MDVGDSSDETLPMGDGKGGDAPAIELPVVAREHYELIAEHARGGLGRIVRARDRRTGRVVAIKEMLDRSPDAPLRFVREARVTANLQHPAIVPVYEVGQWPDGEPFYAMKLVGGRALDEVLAETTSLGERLALLPRVIDVADAIAYAHGEGVVHRDLKPANVLVGRYGETVVIDWGLARRAGEHTTATGASIGEVLDSAVTIAGDVVGTPVYMPPEQARGEAVDARADVYALGAMLYHLLGGHVPYAGARSAAEVLARLIEGPPRPLAELVPEVPRELLAIVSKAMAYQRDDRYPTAQALAADLRRFQTGQLVGAHAYTAWQLLRRWLRRYRAPVAVAAVLLGLLAVVGAVAVRRIAAERNLARRERATAEAERATAVARTHQLLVTQARGAIGRDPTESLAWLKHLPPGVPQWSEARPIIVDAREHGVARWVWTGHDGAAVAVAFSPDGRHVVSGGFDRTIRVWDRRDGAVQVLRAETPLDTLTFVAGGRLLSMGQWDRDRGRQIAVWDLAQRASVLVLFHPARYANAVVSPDGRHVALLTCDGAIDLLDVATLARRALRRGVQGTRPHCVQALAFAPDGAALAADTSGDHVEVLDVADGAVRARLAAGAGTMVNKVAFTADGGRVVVMSERELATWGLARGDRQVLVASDGAVVDFEPTRDGRLVLANDDQTIRTWSLAAGDYRVIARHAGAAPVLVLTPDGRHLAMTSSDGVIRLVGLDGEMATELRGHRGGVNDIAVSPDGAWMASAGDDGAVRVWPLTATQRWFVLGESVTPTLLAAPDPEHVVAVQQCGRVLRVSASGAIATLRPCDAGPRGRRTTARSADGRVLVAARPGGLDLWTDGTPAPRRFEHAADLEGAALSSDGRWLAVVADDGAAILYDVVDDTRRELASPALSRQWRRGVAIAADGGRVVWAERDGALGVYDRGAAAPRQLASPFGEVRAIAVTPDGRIAISVSVTGDAVRWDLATGATTHLQGAAQHRNIVVSPDGEQVVIVGNDHVVRVYPISGAAPRELRGHSDTVDVVAFSPDGRSLATASWDQSVRVWDLATGTSYTVAHTREVVGLAYLADGRRLVTAAEHGVITVVADDVGRDEPALRAFLDDATSLTVDAAGR